MRTLAPLADLTLIVGSQNSSNSVRLTEISANAGTPARLIDDAEDIDYSWFATGEEAVLVSAGASAPEDLVAGVCRALLDRFGGTIEQHDITREHIEFNLPAPLRRRLAERGIEAEPARIAPPTITPESYGAVALTISAGGGRS